jgi:hypothetical protein
MDNMIDFKNQESGNAATNEAGKGKNTQKVSAFLNKQNHQVYYVN